MAAAHAALLERGMAEAVIGGPPLAVFQDLVGLVDFLETDLALGIAAILVRMPLHRELAERRLQLAVVGVAFDFEGLVVAALGRHQFKPARTSSSLPNVEDASFGLMKNDPQTKEHATCLDGVRVMVVARL